MVVVGEGDGVWLPPLGGVVWGVGVGLSDPFAVDVVSVGFGCVADPLGLSVGCCPTKVVWWDTVVCTVSVFDGWATLGRSAEGVAWAEPAAVDVTVALEVDVTVGFATLGCCGFELVDRVGVAVDVDAEGV